MELQGNLVDILNNKIFPAKIKIDRKKIVEIRKVDKKFDRFILPGLIDSHVHVESSMLTPSRFAEIAVAHGTTSIVADPHEIANVLGIEGIEFMIKDSKQAPLKIFFTAPSCVPATPFETNGAILDSRKIEKLMQLPEIVALGEMMNFPGVINRDKEVMRKIEVAKKFHKPIDGHCPGLEGKSLKRYVEVGINTEHECVSLHEAQEKMNLGMKIMIREGSYAKNMNELIELARNSETAKNCFLVSDDLHCEDLMRGHINLLLRKAVSLGVNIFDAVRMVTLNPAKHYSLPVGLLRVGDPADVVIVDSLENFKVLETWIDGRKVAEKGKVLFKARPLKGRNSFKLKKKEAKDFEIKIKGKDFTNVKVIEIVQDQIVTKKMEAKLKIKNGKILPDVENDVIKICVAERYGKNNLSVAFVHGFKLKKGAIASSVAHDSHNVVAIGVEEKSIAKAINAVREMKGGLTVVDRKLMKVALPIAGIMSNENAKQLNRKLEKLFNHAKTMCGFNPFPTLSFLALLVIPELKLSDKGLFDVNKFSFTSLES